MNENIITLACTSDVKVGDRVSLRSHKIVSPSQGDEDVVGQVLAIKRGHAHIQTCGYCTPVYFPAAELRCKAMINYGHDKGKWVEGYYVQIKPNSSCIMNNTHYIYTGVAVLYPQWYPIDVSTLHIIYDEVS